MKSKVFVFLFAVFFMAGLLFICSCAEKPEEKAAKAPAEIINIGALNDMTGATSDVGKDYALGIAEAIRYVNNNGGINGKQSNCISLTMGTVYLRPSPSTNFLKDSNVWPSWDGEPATLKLCHPR